MDYVEHLSRTGIAFVALILSLILSACKASSPSPPSIAVIASPVRTAESPPTRASTPTPTDEPLPTVDLTPVGIKPQPTETLPPLPTVPPPQAMVTHTWDAAPVLIEFATHGGDGGDPFFKYSVDLILYGDQRLFITKYVSGTIQIKETKLSRSETCRLLNSIEQTGFFGITRIDHQVAGGVDQALMDGLPIPMGAPSVYMDVHAWQSNRVDYYELRELLKVLERSTQDTRDKYVQRPIQSVFALL
ncbi:MAG TPA: hypothetical protein VGK87_05885, partial [Anaerolineae bacterium]